MSRPSALSHPVSTAGFSSLPLTRRQVLGAAAGIGAGVATAGRRPALAGPAPLKIGFMLPYSGTYAALGHNITDGFKLRLAALNNRLGGREVELVLLDDESAPPKAKDNAARLILKEKVQVLVGTVHSGVAEAMVQVAREEGILTFIPNAGSNKLTREHCLPTVFRTSFSNWQLNYPAGVVVRNDNHKNVVLMTWNYAAGKEMMGAFKESFLAAGGVIVKEFYPDFPKDEFQPYLTEIAALRPDAVYAFFSGGGTLKFLKDYAAAGLQGKTPLYGPGFLTDGVLEAAGAAAEGVKTTLHYAPTLDIPANHRFRAAFRQATTRETDSFAVQGYDTCSLLAHGLEAVQGDLAAGTPLIQALESASLESPRGPLTLSRAHNPIQNIYLRQVRNGVEVVLGVAHAALADPGSGCRL